MKVMRASTSPLFQTSRSLNLTFTVITTMNASFIQISLATAEISLTQWESPNGNWKIAKLWKIHLGPEKKGQALGLEDRARQEGSRIEKGIEGHSHGHLSVCDLHNCFLRETMESLQIKTENIKYNQVHGHCNKWCWNFCFGHLDKKYEKVKQYKKMVL